MGIYVETLIRAEMGDLWQRTQSPALHQRWDLRFTSIEYLPRENDAEPQRFLYSTRLGFGLKIDGDGESVTKIDATSQTRTSSLLFRSDDWKSLIREGTGYWKYTPSGDGVRFVTAYDYRVRFGICGRMIDRCLFRPLMSWATAWSFDRLRLWIERGIDPALALRSSVVHAVARLSVAFVWLYQGLVPKLIAAHADELAMLADAGLPARAVLPALYAVGLAEVALGILTLVCHRSRWPLALTMLLMALATVAVGVNSPAYLGAAFNPIALNAAVFALALTGLLSQRDLPSAANCLRTRPEDKTCRRSIG